MEKYRKIRIVGKGSFGHAVLAESRISHKLYIIKIINISCMDKKKKQETLNEVLVLKELKNPYIVGYRESFIYKKYFYKFCIVY